MRGRINQSINGRITRGVESFVNNQIVCALAASNFWSSTEYNSNNAWNCNFSSYNTNNNNKYNSYKVRPVAALDDDFRVSILEAYDDCCKHKKSSYHCIMFRLNDEVLVDLADAILERRYLPTVSETFIVKVPKLREIFAASFIDRIVQKGDLRLWEYLPPSKSLFGNGDYKGMAIGNITAQILCNFYMSYYDSWILQRISQFGYDNPERHYCRFVDDYVLHSLPKQVIVQLYKESVLWLREHLHLELHQDKVYIQPQKHGVKFVGGVIMPGRVYLINRTVGAMWDRVRYMEDLCRSIYEFGSGFTKLNTLKHCVSSLNSYQGFMRHARTYNLQKKMLYDLTYFWKVCYTTHNLSVVKIKKKYKLANYLYNEERIQQREAAALRKRQERARKSHQFRHPRRN